MTEPASNQRAAGTVADLDRGDPSHAQPYRDLYENGPVAYLAADPDGRIQRANRRACDLLGYGWSELVGREVLELAADGPDGRGRARDLQRRQMRGEDLEDEELKLRRADGEIIWVSLTVQGVRDDHGRLVERRGVLLDVTERRRARDSLRESEERFQRIFQHSNDGIFVVDPETERIVEANAKASQMLGYDRAELRGLPLESIHPDEMHRLRTFLDGVFRAGGGWTEELTCLTKGGAKLPTEISAGPVEMEGERRVIAAVRDVTERRRAERDLRRALEELEAFSYSVSHDLRAPLRAIDGFSRMLLEDHGDRLDDAGRRLIGVVRDSTRRMGDLIDDLLALSRVGRHEMRAVCLDLAELSQAAFDELTAGSHGPGVDLRLQRPLPAMGDPTMLRQVMGNLLANALKYTRPRRRPVIEVGAELVEGETVFHVRDNGVGFDMAYVDKIFGVFERLHRADEFEGSGVGLAIVKRVVERHGGRVWAEAKKGEGATLYFTLPDGGMQRW
jgi:PAS domain S-box-containing protein